MTKRYMGQIMAECDCQHHGCEMRGYCMAEKIVQLEQKVDEVERRRVKWMNKSDDAEARLDKAMAALREASSFLWHMTNAIDDEDYKGPHDGFNVPLVCHVQPYHDLHVKQLKTQAENVDATLAEIAPYGLEGEK